jgi:hypothetical protein
MHAVQSGVRMLMQVEQAPDEAWDWEPETSPKHLRTGVNSALLDSAAVAGLLISKGLITLDEYEAALADGAEREQRSYEQRLSEIMGSEVQLA